MLQDGWDTNRVHVRTHVRVRVWTHARIRLNARAFLVLRAFKESLNFRFCTYSSKRAKLVWIPSLFTLYLFLMVYYSRAIFTLQRKFCCIKSKVKTSISVVIYIIHSLLVSVTNSMWSTVYLSFFKMFTLPITNAILWFDIQPHVERPQ